jgi:hypothetical protein
MLVALCSVSEEKTTMAVHPLQDAEEIPDEAVKVALFVIVCPFRFILKSPAFALQALRAAVRTAAQFVDCVVTSGTRTGMVFLQLAQIRHVGRCSLLVLVNLKHLLN